MKNRAVLYLGLALIIGLYSYDQSTEDENILPATVVSIESRVAEKGGDTWHIVARMGTDAITLEPRASRPNVVTGARICVTEVTRDGQAAEYLWAPGAATC